eukprot:6055179-Pyramimonas_sp.AAC.1
MKTPNKRRVPLPWEIADFCRRARRHQPHVGGRCRAPNPWIANPCLRARDHCRPDVHLGRENAVSINFWRSARIS